MKLQSFGGGLNTRLAPQLIGQDMGVVYTNIDNTTGVLTPVRSSLATDISATIDHAYFDYAGEWVSFTRPTDFVEYNKVLYYTDGVNTPKKYDGETVSLLGIKAPSSVGTQTAVLGPSVIKSATVVPTEVPAGEGLDDEELHYYIVNTKQNAISNALYLIVNADGVTTEETNASSLVYPTIVETNTGGPNLSVAFSEVLPKLAEDGAEIYRYYDGAWYYVATMIDEDATFTDATNDISGNKELTDDQFSVLQGVYQYVMTYYDINKGTESAPSPVSDEIDLSEEGGLVYLASLPVSTDSQVTHKRLYRVGGDVTVFSLVVELDNSVVEYYDSIKDSAIEGATLETEYNGTPPIGLRYIKQAYAILFGAVGSRLYFTEIGEPDNWPSLNFLEMGLPITGIAPVANGILVFSKYSSQIVLGTDPSLLSRQTVAGDQGCLDSRSIQSLGSAAVWVSTDGICVSTGGDVQVVSKYVLGKFEANVVSSAIHDQTYYIVTDQYEMYAMDMRFETVFKHFSLDMARVTVADDTLYGWKTDTVFSLFAGNGHATFEYLSPRYVEGQATKSKLYKNVYFYIEGDIMVKVYVNDDLVFTKSLSGKGNHQLKLPQDSKRAHSLQLGISGTGTVHEIYWEADANE